MQTLKELRQLMPLSNMYEIREDTRYIVQLLSSMSAPVVKIVFQQLARRTRQLPCSGGE